MFWTYSVCNGLFVIRFGKAKVKAGIEKKTRP